MQTTNYPYKKTSHFIDYMKKNPRPPLPYKYTNDEFHCNMKKWLNQNYIESNKSLSGVEMGLGNELADKYLYHVIGKKK
jgi:hypothetical protein